MPDAKMKKVYIVRDAHLTEGIVTAEVHMERGKIIHLLPNDAGITRVNHSRLRCDVFTDRAEAVKAFCAKAMARIVSIDYERAQLDGHLRDEGVLE